MSDQDDNQSSRSPISPIKGRVTLAALVPATHLKSRAAYEARQFIDSQTEKEV